MSCNMSIKGPQSFTTTSENSLGWGLIFTLLCAQLYQMPKSQLLTTSVAVHSMSDPEGVYRTGEPHINVDTVNECYMNAVFNLNS